MSLINIGMSGLNASQSGLATVGNNIANANTAGYSRQSNVQVSSASNQFGNVFIGSGTTLADVRRIYNSFLDSQLQTTTALSSDAKAYLDQIGSVDKLLSDKTTGITTALSGFFSALQTSAATPDNVPARQLLLTSAETLSNRFNSIASQLNQQNEGINSQLGTLTSQVNQLTSSIAALNLQISQSSTGGSGPANLLDARNEAVRSLNELVGVKVHERDGSYDISLGTGQSLVLGSIANTLSATPSTNDKNQYNISINYGQTSADITSVVTGGKIGGLVRYRDEVLAPAMYDLGRTAMVVTGAINTQLGQGLDANGEFGTSLFNNLNSATAITQRSQGATTNSAGSGNLNVSIKDTSALSVFDYKVTFSSPTAYSVTRSDGKAMGSFDSALPAPNPPLVFDGVSLAPDGAGPMQAGDSFTVSPTRSGASNIGVQLTDANKLAFAGPLVATSTGNDGTGIMDAPSLTLPLDIYGGADLAQQRIGIEHAMPVKIAFGKPDPLTGTQSYKVFDSKGADIGSGSIIPGQKNALTINVPMRDATGAPMLDAASQPRTFAFNTAISGAPADGDGFTVKFNAEGKSDNRNANAMLELQNKPTVGISNGNAGFSITSSYSRLVEQVGANASKAGVDNAANNAILTSAKAARNSVSGVNLEDEASDLLKFQQYYTASSQIIKAAQETFSTLINSL